MTGKYLVLNHRIIVDNKSEKRQGRQKKSKRLRKLRIQYLRDKMGINSQAVTGALLATGSKERNTFEKYLKDKHGK